MDSAFSDASEYEASDNTKGFAHSAELASDLANDHATQCLHYDRNCAEEVPVRNQGEELEVGIVERLRSEEGCLQAGHMRCEQQSTEVEAMSGELGE